MHKGAESVPKGRQARRYQGRVLRILSICSTRQDRSKCARSAHVHLVYIYIYIYITSWDPRRSRPKTIELLRKMTCRILPLILPDCGGQTRSGRSGTSESQVCPVPGGTRDRGPQAKEYGQVRTPCLSTPTPAPAKINGLIIVRPLAPLLLRYFWPLLASCLSFFFSPEGKHQTPSWQESALMFALASPCCRSRSLSLSLSLSRSLFLSRRRTSRPLRAGGCWQVCSLINMSVHALNSHAESDNSEAPSPLSFCVVLGFFAPVVTLSFDPSRGRTPRPLRAGGRAHVCACEQERAPLRFQA